MSNLSAFLNNKATVYRREGYAIKIPNGVDPAVFISLPPHIQTEIALNQTNTQRPGPSYGGNRYILNERPINAIFRVRYPAIHPQYL